MGGKPSMPKQQPPVQVIEPKQEEVEEEIRKRFLEGGRQSTILSTLESGRGILG
jgi:hypothetical protein